MDVSTFKELCQRLDQLAAILEIMEGEPINVDLHREASNALYQALSEFERLQSDTDRHRETSNSLRDALAEIERLQADADLHHKTSEALRDAVGEIERLRFDADRHRETSNALRDALAEIKRLQADVDLHHKTSEALRDALVEIKRQRSDTADLQNTKFDGGQSNVPPVSVAGATDWFKKFLERMRALIDEKVSAGKAMSSSQNPR
jgi:hypothetical protein